MNEEHKSATSKSSSEIKPPTTFLSLPHELRQAIFILAKPTGMTYLGEWESIRTTAADWKKIRVGLVDDVAYAEKKWMDMLTDELYKAIRQGLEGSRE